MNSIRSEINEFQCKDPRSVRLSARTGALDSTTAGMAPGYVQCNLVVLPREYALDFASFCQRNPKPCPLLSISDSPLLPTMGDDIDIRTDIPRYRIYLDGILSEEVMDVRRYWNDNLISFLIGCSFSFEQAMIENELPVRHIEQNCNVPMYRTNIQTVPAGHFGGPIVVSMRPLKPVEAIKAIQITSRFSLAHGAPIHFGNPQQIGIHDLDNPEYGDSVRIDSGELPVFWACGVTPQVAIANARPKFCITHAPGCMLVTDIKNKNLTNL